MKEIPLFLREAKLFGDYIDSVRRAPFIHSNVFQNPVQFQIKSSIPFQQQIGEAWDTNAYDYINQEPKTAFCVTMASLLMSCGIKLSNKGPWLSLGSGPGLYETYLVDLFRNVSMYSLDLSSRFTQVQKDLAKAISTEQPDFNKKFHPVVGSMNDLPFRDGSFENVLCVNSLHWCPDWKVVIKEIDRVLAKKEGASVFIVLASAKMGNRGNITEIAKDLTDESLLDECYIRGFHPTILGNLVLDKGQFGIPTTRSYCLVERKAELKKPWLQRIKDGEIPIADFYMAGNNLTIKKYGKKT